MLTKLNFRETRNYGVLFLFLFSILAGVVFRFSHCPRRYPFFVVAKKRCAQTYLHDTILRFSFQLPRRSPPYLSRLRSWGFLCTRKQVAALNTSLLASYARQQRPLCRAWANRIICVLCARHTSRRGLCCRGCHSFQLSSRFKFSGLGIVAYVMTQCLQFAAWLCPPESVFDTLSSGSL